MEKFNNYLKSIPGYRPEILEEIQPYYSLRKLAAEEFFLQEGRVSKEVAFVESGLVRLYYLHDGKEVTQCFCREGSLVTSYKSLILQAASEIAIQAVEPSHLVILPQKGLESLYEKNHFWQLLTRLASEQEYIRVEDHNRFLRDLSATERYIHILNHDKELLQRLPLNYLATYLQVAPETLSRIRNKISGT